MADEQQAAKAKILYIEDDRASQLLVKRVLDNRGYQVFLAGEGLKGIALAKEQRPNLVLMDINLPNMDGREITTRLRSIPHFAAIPIIALTANNSPGSRELALAAGCSGFMTKPIDVGTFPGEVEKYLKGHQETLSPDEQSQHLRQHAQNVVERLEDKLRELETTNAELEAANKHLRELDRLKSDFILLVSHELRTPLTLVSGYTHLLEENLKSGDDMVSAEMVRSLATGLDQGVGRMQEVVNEIINVSRIASGSLDLSLGPVRLPEILARVETEFQEICQPRNLTFMLQQPAELPVLQADGKQLKLALEQILGNAVKYTPDGGEVMLAVRVLDAAVNIIIRDTGIGIPLAQQRKIFDQFYTLGDIAHHSTSKYAFQGGGLGLGLAIAKGIIEAHNGRIWVESKERNTEKLPGSTFYILLPVENPALDRRA